MMTMDSEEDIKSRGARLVVALVARVADADERAQFAAWCAEDPRHAAAYRRFESIWQEAATLEELKPLAALPPARDPWWHRVRVEPGGSPAALGCECGSRGGDHCGRCSGICSRRCITRPGIAEVREIHLSDGSEVTLGARSSLEVAFRLHERRVALTSGLAFFSVSKNPSRPFIVLVGDKEVRVVGTKFEVRRDPAGMRVSVVEGTVEVMQVPERASETSREAPRTVRLAAKVTQPASATIPDGAAIAPTLLTPTNPPRSGS